MQKPDRKVAAGGLAGALTTLALYLLHQSGVEITGDVGAAIGALIGFAVAYFVPNPPTEPAT